MPEMLTREVIGEWPEWFELTERQTQITTQIQKSILECTPHRNLRQMGYNSRTSHWVSLLLAKNRKLSLHWVQAHQNRVLSHEHEV